MKTVRTFPVLALCLLAVLEPARAAERYRYAQYQVPRRHAPPATGQTNQANRAKPPEPADKPVKFKDLPLNAEFYFLADKDAKLFPRIKISNTSAKSVPTAANRSVTTNAVPAETLVFQKKGGDKKEQSSQKDDKKTGRSNSVQPPSREAPPR